jgi:hypothetical protein
MKIEIATYDKHGYDHEPYQKESTMILSIKDGILFLGEESYDKKVDAKEMLIAIETLIKEGEDS